MWTVLYTVELAPLSHTCTVICPNPKKHSSPPSSFQQLTKVHKNAYADHLRVFSWQGGGGEAADIHKKSMLIIWGTYLHGRFKGTVQRELRWVKIGINRTAMKICIDGKCSLSCSKGHHHERSINILGGCSTFYSNRRVSGCPCSCQDFKK